jgi:hypothetical protein
MYGMQFAYGNGVGKNETEAAHYLKQSDEMCEEFKFQFRGESIRLSQMF